MTNYYDCFNFWIALKNQLERKSVRKKKREIERDRKREMKWRRGWMEVEGGGGVSEKKK